MSGMPLAPGSDGWMQVGFAVTDPSDVFGFFGSDLASLISDWATRERTRTAFFLRKPPGVVVRVGLSAARRDQVAETREIESELSRCLGNRIVPHNRIGPYLPESFLMGGEAGTVLGHTFHALDSRAVLAHLRRQLAGDVGMPSVEFSLSLLFATFTALTGDPWEHWDVWCRFDTAGRLLSADPQLAGADRPASPQQTASDGKAEGPNCVRRRRAADWVRLHFDPGPTVELRYEPLREFRDALPALASHAGQLAPQMSSHLRSVLPFWAAHHWNRMGFDLVTQRTLTELVIDSCDPRRSSRDAEMADEQLT